MDLAPEQFIVIGDTPNDIDCARHFGARAVAVGTGRFSRREILACKPDALLPDLSDVDLVLRTLEDLKILAKGNKSLSLFAPLRFAAEI